MLECILVQLLKKTAKGTPLTGEGGGLLCGNKRRDGKGIRKKALTGKFRGR